MVILRTRQFLTWNYGCLIAARFKLSQDMDLVLGREWRYAESGGMPSRRYLGGETHEL